MVQATPYRDYRTVAGFDHPYGDYRETTSDGAGNFFSIWAESESKAGSGDVHYAKFRLSPLVFIDREANRRYK